MQHTWYAITVNKCWQDEVKAPDHQTAVAWSLMEYLRQFPHHTVSTVLAEVMED